MPETQISSAERTAIQRADKFLNSLSDMCIPDEKGKFKQPFDFRKVWTGFLQLQQEKVGGMPLILRPGLGESLQHLADQDPRILEGVFDEVVKAEELASKASDEGKKEIPSDLKRQLQTALGITVVLGMTEETTDKELELAVQIIRHWAGKYGTSNDYIWKAQEGDIPVRVNQILGKGHDGREYVAIAGYKTGIPRDELDLIEKELGQTAKPQGEKKQGPIRRFVRTFFRSKSEKEGATRSVAPQAATESVEPAESLENPESQETEQDKSPFITVWPAELAEGKTEDWPAGIIREVSTEDFYAEIFQEKKKITGARAGVIRFKDGTLVFLGARGKEGAEAQEGIDKVLGYLTSKEDGERVETFFQKPEGILDLTANPKTVKDFILVAVGPDGQMRYYSRGKGWRVSVLRNEGKLYLNEKEGKDKLEPGEGLELYGQEEEEYPPIEDIVFKYGQPGLPLQPEAAVVPNVAAKAEPAQAAVQAGEAAASGQVDSDVQAVAGTAGQTSESVQNLPTLEAAVNKLEIVEGQFQRLRDVFWQGLLRNSTAINHTTTDMDTTQNTLKVFFDSPEFEREIKELARVIDQNLDASELVQYIESWGRDHKIASFAIQGLESTNNEKYQMVKQLLFVKNSPHKYWAFPNYKWTNISMTHAIFDEVHSRVEQAVELLDCVDAFKIVSCMNLYLADILDSTSRNNLVEDSDQLLTKIIDLYGGKLSKKFQNETSKDRG